MSFGKVMLSCWVVCMRILRSEGGPSYSPGQRLSSIAADSVHLTVIDDVLIVSFKEL